MTPAEHYAEAGRLLASITVAPEDWPLPDMVVLLTKAQVHATLATVDTNHWSIPAHRVVWPNVAEPG